LLPAGVLDELKLNYVDCEACIVHASQSTSTMYIFNSFETQAGSNLGKNYKIL
jgi:hypothetical protein